MGQTMVPQLHCKGPHGATNPCQNFQSFKTKRHHHHHHTEITNREYPRTVQMPVSVLPFSALPPPRHDANDESGSDIEMGDDDLAISSSKAIVTPGEHITSDPQWMRGHGTYIPSQLHHINIYFPHLSPKISFPYSPPSSSNLANTASTSAVPPGPRSTVPNVFSSVSSSTAPS